MLTDTDKGSQKRSSPTVNKNDQLPPDVVMAKGTLSTTHLTPVNATGGQRVQLLNSQVLGFNNNNQASILFGQDSTGKMVLKAAATGYDARTATNQYLTFNSENIAVQVGEGPYTVALNLAGPTAGTQTTATGSITFANTYSTPPLVLASIVGGGLFGAGDFSSSTNSGTLIPISYSFGSSSNITITTAMIEYMNVTSTGVNFEARYINGSGSTLSAVNIILDVYVINTSSFYIA